MQNATIWIENNPSTGSKRPWEVYFQVDGRPVRFIASAASEAGAQKSAKSLLRRCDGMYNAAIK